MKKRSLLPKLAPLPLLFAALAGACGDDPVGGDDAATSDASTTEAAPPSDGAAQDARPLDAPVDVAEAGPLRAPFGLDVRPPNPTCKAPARPKKSGREVRFTQVFQGAGLTSPMVLAQIPGDRTRFFAAELGGNIVSFAAQNPTAKTVVGRVPGEVYTEGECGLLGMAFHPRFAQNGYVYLSYVRETPAFELESLVVRMQSPDNGATFGNPVVILGPYPEMAANHKGGDLHFGNDGFLYASFGDGGGLADPFGNGQSRFGHFSKILRIDVDSAFPYAIPDGNPFKAGGGEPATFAYGFRNPYRFSIDPVTGDVWTGDVGEADWEEVDKVVAGGNYGWSLREGAHCFPPGSSCNQGGLVDPYWEYGRDTGVCLIGGPIYRGTKMPDLVGSYLGADCAYTNVFTLSPDPVTGAPVYTRHNPEGPGYNWLGFSEDLDHEVYLMSYDSRVYALDQGPGTPGVSFPEKLSQTGCFDAADPKSPVAAMIPYAPVAPFFSDDADKERFFAIPDGTTIGIGPDGDFDFPNGTVLAKHFRVAGRLVETRLFVRHDDGEWGGYTYEWNATQTDATLLPAGKTVALPQGKSWYFPDRGECLACHTQPAGRSLGLETAQLDSDFVYTRNNRLSNQLATLAHIGVLASAPPSAQTVPRLVAPFGQAPLEARARSYLHTNCAGCHRPQGPGRGPMDLRFARSFAQTNTCNAEPVAGNLGVAGAKLLTPGAPATSLLSLRLRAQGAGRMPNVATRTTDTAGAGLVDAFIRAQGACP